MGFSADILSFHIKTSQSHRRDWSSSRIRTTSYLLPVGNGTHISFLSCGAHNIDCPSIRVEHNLSTNVIKCHDRFSNTFHYCQLTSLMMTQFLLALLMTSRTAEIGPNRAESILPSAIPRSLNSPKGMKKKGIKRKVFCRVNIEWNLVFRTNADKVFVRYFIRSLNSSQICRPNFNGRVVQ